MGKTFQAVIWAGIIIVAALCMNSLGLNQGASFGITSGLTGAAWGSIYSDRALCSKVGAK